MMLAALMLKFKTTKVQTCLPADRDTKVTTICFVILCWLVSSLFQIELNVVPGRTSVRRKGR
jgi:hypothetical protein